MGAFVRGWLPTSAIAHTRVPLGGWGAINVERVCRLVLRGVRTWSPFEAGILHSDGGVGCPPIGLGVSRVGSKKLGRGGWGEGGR